MTGPSTARSLLALAALGLMLMSVPVLAQDQITTPKEALGFNLGDDYCLATYRQLVSYWRQLEQESNRMRVEVIGTTEEGRDQLMAIVTSPENHAKLDRLKEISRNLALAEGLDDSMARALAEEGRAVVWIDGGLHASEVLVAQQLMETVYQMVSRNDRETLRFLDDVVILFCNPNPDGQDLVADWYMREKDPKKRSTRSLPRLYQKYIGHDNNRDFYMVTQKETENLCRIFFQEWFPQIVYNHHQTGPSGTVLFAPPFRDPFNYNLDPLVPLGINLVGASMHSRFVVEGKRGSTMRKGASYSTWWNGGLRTSCYFHNMIGLLTETIGHPTPMKIPLRLRRQLASGDLPAPIAPQKWHFRQSVEYSVTANRAVLDVASRHREQFLYNIYRMGKNSIEAGNRDHWTILPDRIEVARKAMDAAKKAASEKRSKDKIKKEILASATDGNRKEKTGSDKKDEEAKGPDFFKEILHDPKFRDARGWIIPSDQVDFLTATKFVNTLIKNGVTVHRAASIFEVGGKTYPKDSFVVKAAQAFRPHIRDMFEPQVHPDDIPYPGGPPVAPYDSAGWTLAFQMGVAFDRILEGFDGPFERIVGLARPIPGVVTTADGAVGFLTSHRTNDAFIAINRLVKDGEEVRCLENPVEIAGVTHPSGTIFIRRGEATLGKLKGLAKDLGLRFAGVAKQPVGSSLVLRPVRIGLWDRYGGSMASGWVRWLLERFEFDFGVVYPQELDKGSLNEKYDVLVFVGGAISAPRPDSSPDQAGRGTGRRGRSGRRGRRGPDKKRIPKEYHDRLGKITAEKTVPQLAKFLEKGGTILTIGSSTSLAKHLKLPVGNALLEHREDGSEGPLPRSKFFVPGSLLRARVDNTHPLAWGLDDHLDVVFRRSPVFKLKPDAASQGLKPIAWFDSRKSLRSGWAWGQHRLEDGIAVVEAQVGKGLLFLFGPEITFRAQPHASFKFLFNGILYGPARNQASAETEPVEAGSSGN